MGGGAARIVTYIPAIRPSSAQFFSLSIAPDPENFLREFLIESILYHLISFHQIAITVAP